MSVAPAGPATGRRVSRGELTTLLGLGLLGRLPMSMMNLALVLFTRHLGYGYLVVGVVAGASTIAIGVASPLVGRLVDRVGAVPVLVVTAFGGGLTLLAMGLWGAHMNAAGLIALAALSGVLTPPITSVYRASLPRLAAPERLRTLYSLEAACQEAIYVAGPVLIVGFISAVSARGGVFLLALLTGVISLGFTAAMARHPAPPRAARPRGAGPLRDPRMRRLMAAYGSMGATFGVVELGTIGALERNGDAGVTGWVLGAWALGSLIGGLVVTRMWHAEASRRLTWALAAMAVLALPLIVVHTAHPVVIAVALVIEGCAIAPAIGAVYEIIAGLADESTITESFSWSLSAVITGAALGTALAGALVHAIGPGPTFWAAVACPAAAAALAYPLRHTHEV